MTDPVSLIPRPRSITWTGETWITEDPWAELVTEVSSTLPASDHALTVSSHGAVLRAGSQVALAEGKATFAELVRGGGGKVPGVVIADGPRYRWRGLMIDVARHFEPIAQLEKMIDAMALYRLNVLHLHLTDDQGWRIEIDGYPRLTEVGAWRDQTIVGHNRSYERDPASALYDGQRHGGFYTQKELADLVGYARERGITIVPEIDLPGHMQAAIAAYPELGNLPDRQLNVKEEWGISNHVLNVSDAAFRFVREVLTQVCRVFPGSFVHIGGDECPTVEWSESPTARARMSEWGLTSARELQGRYSVFASEVLKAHGKRMVGWDEVLEAELPQDSVVMIWRHETDPRQATRRGFEAVVSSSRALYLDHYQGDEATEPLAIGGHTTLRNVYEFEPVPADLSDRERALVLGVQGQLWTEYMKDAKALEYMAFPRLLALAELAWGSPKQSYEEFEARVRAHLPELARRGINYRELG
jgi:hexosaminidase